MTFNPWILFKWLMAGFMLALMFAFLTEQAGGPGFFTVGFIVGATGVRRSLTVTPPDGG